MNIKIKLDRRDVLLFLAFYYVLALSQYIVSFFAWGGFADKGHPPFWSFEEFWASAGADFLLRLILTFPVWFIVFVKLKKHQIKSKLLAYLVLLPLLAIMNYYIMTQVQAYFDWASVHIGSRKFYDINRNLLFFIMQFGLMHSYVYYKKQGISNSQVAQTQEPEVVGNEELPPLEDRILLSKGNKRILVETNEISYIEAFGDYCKVYVNGEKLLASRGISQTIAKLNEKTFIRVHRSYVVNLEKVTELLKKGRYYYLKLDSDVEVKISDTYLHRIKSLVV